MQTTAIGTVANSLPENEAILLTILISDGYIPYTDLKNILFRIGIRKGGAGSCPKSLLLKCFANADISVLVQTRNSNNFIFNFDHL